MHLGGQLVVLFGQHTEFVIAWQIELVGQVTAFAYLVHVRLKRLDRTDDRAFHEPP